MSDDYEHLKAEYERLKAKQDGKIAAAALREVRWDIEAARQELKGASPVGMAHPMYHNGYQNGMSYALEIIDAAIKAHESQ